ncbi:MAG: hypothetical protein HKO53_00825 [Gemmatimonadetes bacterium]|nr:hypothetical protein [Gemmatimonadota bacterium]
MNARQVRERQYRRVLATALGVSAAVHGVVLGWSSFSVSAPAPDSPVEREAQEAPATFEKPALKLVSLEAPSAPAPQSVVAPGQAPQRIAEDAKPAAASPEAMLESQVALSMQFDFNTQREMENWALQPIQFAGNLDGGDEDDEKDEGAHDHSGGRSWWEGLGLAIGIGGGGHCPVPDRGVPTVISRDPPG